MPKSFKRRSLGRGIPVQTGEQMLHLKLFLRHPCPQCSETDVAQEIWHLPHVLRVRSHAERHELEIWASFPAEGLLREIMGVLRAFCCDLVASHVR